ncbi:MAG TPA: VOC family protein [Edaphobacter sp.]|jgi:catechol 2,3-dioxygenase-like lactoylglutathione lyase family enzyme|nr:VOC family protein [Edaphobacter sp.]
MSKTKATLTLLFTLATSHLLAQAPTRPKILGISHAGYFVSDLPKALDFWHGLLGYDEPYDLKNPDGTVHIAFIKINDHQHIELFNQQPPAGSGHLSHIAFVVSNAEQMRAYLASRGIPVGAKVGKGRTGDLNFEIKDPDGNLVEFVEPQSDGMEAKSAGKFLPATRISESIYHLGFLVGDSAKSIAFYGDLLGFREFWRGSSKGTVLSWIDMRVPDGEDYIEFMLYSDLPTPDKRGGQEHTSLSVPDIPKSIAILEARPAYKTYAKLLESHTGVNGQRQVNLFDPDGTRVELMEPFTASGKPVPPSTAAPPH